MIASVSTLAIVLSGLSTGSVATISEQTPAARTRMEDVQIQRSQSSEGMVTSFDRPTKRRTPPRAEEAEPEPVVTRPEESGASGLGSPPAVPIGRLSSIAAVTATTGFDGMAEDPQDPRDPPDPSIAVGPNYLVEVTNSHLRVFDLSGNVTSDMTLMNFLPFSVQEPFDVRTLYDPYTGRFLVLTLEFPEISPHMNLAVSDTRNPNGTWHTYRFDGVFALNGNGYRSDYPSVGVDKSALYVAAPLFSQVPHLGHGCVYRVFPKDQLLSGGTVAPTDILTTNSFQVRAAHECGSASGPYFASAVSTTSIKIECILQPLSQNPSLVSCSVAVPAFAFPNITIDPVPEPSPGGPITPLDGRLMNAVYRNNTLYMCHAIFESNKTVVRWYEVSMNGWPAVGLPSLKDSGDIDAGNDSLGSPIHTFYPFIAVNGCDEIGVVFAQSSANLYPGVAITGRVPSDPPGTMGAIVSVKARGYSTSPTGRWGDYSTIAVDPVTNSTFWCVGEYADSVHWRTWVSSFFASALRHPCPR